MTPRNDQDPSDSPAPMTNDGIKHAIVPNRSRVGELGWWMLSTAGLAGDSQIGSGRILRCVLDVIAKSTDFLALQCIARTDAEDPSDVSQASLWIDLVLKRATSPFHDNAHFTTAEFNVKRRMRGGIAVERSVRSFPMPLGLINSFTVNVYYHQRCLAIELGLEDEFAITSVAVAEFGSLLPNILVRDGLQYDSAGPTRAELRAVDSDICWQ
jgi:hypothetical protein